MIEHWDTCGWAWIALLRHVWSAGEAGLAEREPIIEGPPALVEIASLSGEDPILREYGEPRPPAARAASLGRRFERPDYAAELFEMQGAGQLRWVVDLLRARPWTTNVWISLAVPGEPGDPGPSPAALSFRIRKHSLIMTAMFRSQNVFTGYLTYIPLRVVQVEVAERLALPAGPLRVFIDVPHVYVSDAERVAAILAAVPAPNAA